MHFFLLLENQLASIAAFAAFAQAATCGIACLIQFI
jgi:hypothetical protein